MKHRLKWKRQLKAGGFTIAVWYYPQMTDLLKTALDERRRLDKVIAFLQGDSTPTKTNGRRQKRKSMSAAARKKISEAQKARWAKEKKS